MNNKLEIEWERMYNPILGNIFVEGIDWDNYIVIKRTKMDKNTIYPSKEAYLDGIEQSKLQLNRK